jgi:hypothetical protein
MEAKMDKFTMKELEKDNVELKKQLLDDVYCISELSKRLNATGKELNNVMKALIAYFQLSNVDARLALMLKENGVGDETLR